MPEKLVEVDISRAQAKISRLKNMDQLFNKKLRGWEADTVTILKRRATQMQKSGRGRKTGFLAQNVGRRIVEAEGRPGVVIGTGGEVGKRPVVYARIQDEGGTIIPRKAKWLTIPLRGVKGIAQNYPDSFIVKSKRGNLLICQRDDRGRLKPLFVLRKQVKIPPTYWFTNVMAGRVQELERTLAPTVLVDELLGYGPASAIWD